MMYNAFNILSQQIAIPYLESYRKNSILKEGFS